jgi:peptide/nickel transport system substrate-binding protein
MLHISRRAVLAGAGAAAASLSLSDILLAQGAQKVLIIASGQDIPNFDPHVTTGYSPAWLMRNVYDSLVRVEGNPPQPVPGLAESWTTSPDGMTFTFKLNPAAKFHDGSPVDAAAVKYSFERIMRLKKGNGWMVNSVLGPESIKVIDPTTLEFKLTKPFVAFLQVLPWQWIVNPKLVEANKAADDGQAWLGANIAGSGAFVLKRSEPGNLYEVERASDGWRKGGGNVTNVIWQIVRETVKQRNMIQAGQVHMAMDLTSEDIDALKGKPGVNLIIEPEFRTFSIKMNTANGPLADINLRRAVSYAFDYDAMLELAGYADLMTGPLPNGIFGFDKDLKVPRTDLAKAKEFLAKSTNPNGGIKLTMMHVTGLEQQRRWSLVLLDSLKKLNIDLDIKPMVWPDMVASTKSPQTAPDFFPVYQTANFGDPDNIAFAAYHSANNGNWQNMVYKDPKVDDLIERGRAEPDVAKRAVIYKQMQEQIVDDAPDIFGVLEKRKLAIRSDVKNFKFVPIASNAPELFDLSLGS